MLKTKPKGYEINHENIELLKHKSFVAMKSFTDSELRDQDVVELVKKTSMVISPLNQFLNRAMLD